MKGVASLIVMCAVVFSEASPQVYGMAQGSGVNPRARSVSGPYVNPALALGVRADSGKRGSLSSPGVNPSLHADKAVKKDADSDFGRKAHSSRSGSLQAGSQSSVALHAAPMLGGGRGAPFQGAPVSYGAAKLMRSPAHTTGAVHGGGARGAPAAGMDNYYSNVHLKNAKVSSFNNVGSLDGAIVAGKSGRASHTRDGDEVAADGKTSKLRGTPQNPALFDKMKTALGLGNNPTAKPTPPQPTYLNEKSSARLYAPDDDSFFTKFYNKVFGSDGSDAPAAYMDGISRPDWSLGHSP